MMGARAPSRVVVAAAAAMALGIAALAAMPAGQVDRATTHFLPAVAAVATVSMGWVVWRTDPAYTLSAAIFLTPFAGNWPQLGVPGPLSPDRLLLAGATAAVLLRAPPVADRPRLQITGAHWVLALAAVYGFASAFLADTLFERDAFFKLVDAFGVMPFLLFLVAPLAFRTPRQRHVLLVTLVVLGAYLALTVLFEMAKLDALVFPKYILDPNYGIHASSRTRSVRRRRGQRARALFLRSRVRHRVRLMAPRMVAYARGDGRPPVPRRQLPQPRTLGLDRRRARNHRRDALAARPAPLPDSAGGRQRRGDRRVTGPRPGPVGERHGAREQLVDHLGPQEPRTRRRKHGGGQATGRLRMEPLHKQQQGLLSAGFRLPADSLRRRHPQHAADVRGRPGTCRDDPLARRAWCPASAPRSRPAGRPTWLAGASASWRSPLPTSWS